MTTDRVRTTISLDPEVYDIFKRMAEAGGMSVSRCMGEWLADTSDGAQFVAQKMVEAREAPMVVMREMHAMAAGIHTDVSKTMDMFRKGGRADARSGPTYPPSDTGRCLIAPSSNTGLKETGKLPKRKKSS